MSPRHTCTHSHTHNVQHLFLTECFEIQYPTRILLFLSFRLLFSYLTALASLSSFSLSPFRIISFRGYLKMSVISMSCYDNCHPPPCSVVLLFLLILTFFFLLILFSFYMLPQSPPFFPLFSSFICSGSHAVCWGRFQRRQNRGCCVFLLHPLFCFYFLTCFSSPPSRVCVLLFLASLSVFFFASVFLVNVE